MTSHETENNTKNNVETQQKPNKTPVQTQGLSNDLGPAALGDFRRLQDHDKFRRAWKKNSELI